MTKNTLIMYVVDNHVRCLDKYLYCHVRCCQSCTKQCQTKSDEKLPLCSFFTFFQRREGPLQRSENVKKQQSGPVWIWLSQTTTIIMYVSFYNHVRREDKHQCYHVRCWPSCTLWGTNICIIMYVAVSHVRSNVKQNPIKICSFAAFLRFLCFPSAAKGPCSGRKT